MFLSKVTVSLQKFITRTYGPLTGYVYLLNSSASEKAIISLFLCFLSLNFRVPPQILITYLIIDHVNALLE